jgi:uncharacterized membrane protein YkoI
MSKTVSRLVRYLSVYLFAGLLLAGADISAADNTPVSVTITQRTPMETLAADGSIMGVGEATVGTRFTFVSASGAQVTLQDAQGMRYRIAQSSTDYSAAATFSSSSTNSAPVPAVSAPTDTGLSLSALTQGVQQTIQSNLDGRTVTHIARTVDEGDVSYDIETTAGDGELWDMTVDEDGTLQSIEVLLSEVPPAVQTAINTQTGKGRLEGVEKLMDDGETTYQAGITAMNGDERDFTFSEDGTLLSQEVGLSDLPPALQMAVNRQIGQGNLEEIDKNFDEGAITYDATMTDTAGQERDFTLAENGMLLSEEVSLSDLPPALQAAVNGQVGQGKLEGIDETFDGGTADYEASMATSDGQERDFTLGSDGTLVSREISLSETPAVVQDTITRRIGGGKIIEIDQSYDTKRPQYQVEGEKDGQSIDFTVGPKGRLLGMGD